VSELADTFDCGHPRVATNMIRNGSDNGVPVFRCRECARAANRNSVALKRQYAKFGITDIDVRSAPLATPFLKKLGELTDCIDALRASPDPTARAFIRVYDSEIPVRTRPLVPFEAYCVAAKVCPSRVTEVIVAVLAKQRVLEGAVIAALAHPTIMRANAHAAAFEEGVVDRMAHLKMVGAMPLPKSSQTVVNVNATANAAAAAKSDSAALPSAEETIRRIVEAQQQARAITDGQAQPALPAPTETPMAFMPRQRDMVAVDADYEDVSSD
jgi:hypothetical protein